MISSKQILDQLNQAIISFWCIKHRIFLLSSLLVYAHSLVVDRAPWLFPGPAAGGAQALPMCGALSLEDFYIVIRVAARRVSPISLTQKQLIRDDK
jgi:hypothetical protein